MYLYIDIHFNIRFLKKDHLYQPKKNKYQKIRHSFRYFRTISVHFRALPRISAYFRDFPHLEIGFQAFEIVLFHFRNVEINIKVAEIAEIAESTSKGNQSTKLHIKKRKPQFKLRKALFQKVFRKKR